jgi:hypothetical protein
VIVNFLFFCPLEFIISHPAKIPTFMRESKQNLVAHRQVTSVVLGMREMKFSIKCPVFATNVPSCVVSTRLSLTLTPAVFGIIYREANPLAHARTDLFIGSGRDRDGEMIATLSPHGRVQRQTGVPPRRLPKFSNP